MRDGTPSPSTLHQFRLTLHALVVMTSASSEIGLTQARVNRAGRSDGGDAFLSSRFLARNGKSNQSNQGKSMRSLISFNHLRYAIIAPSEFQFLHKQQNKKGDETFMRIAIYGTPSWVAECSCLHIFPSLLQNVWCFNGRLFSLSRSETSNGAH